MRKVVALLLAVLMVTSCMMFTVAAEEANTETGFEFVGVSDCDTANGWVAGSVYTDEKTQGNASIMTSMSGTTTAVGALMLQYTGVAKDVSDMTMLVFDLYVSDVEAIKGVSWELELRDVNGTTDANELSLRATLNDIFGKELVSGWNQVELPLSTLGVKGEVDLAQWNYFRMYSGEGSSVEYGGEEDTVIAIDNMYFCNKEVTINSYMLSDFNGNGMFYTAGTGALATTTWAKSFYGVGTGFGRWDSGVTGGEYVIGNTKDAGGKLGTDNFFRSTLQNMAAKIANAASGGNVFNYPEWFAAGEKTAFQMDVYMSAEGLKDAYGEDITVGDLSIGLSLAMGTTDSWGFCPMATARLKDGQDLGNGWYRVTLPTSLYENINLQQLYALKIHGDIDMNYGVTYTSNFVVKVDNLRFLLESDYVAPEPEQPNRFFDGRYLLSTWDYESGILADLPWNKTKNVTWAASFKGQGTDFAGQVASEANGALIIANDTDGGSLAMNNYFLSTIEGNPGGVPEWMDDPFVDAIEIDVKIDATGLKKDGKDMAATELAINWGMQTDAGKDTSNRAGYSRYIFTLEGAKDLGDGWYRVTIPAENFSKYLVPGYSWVNMLYMDFRGDVEANVGVTYDSLTISIDNIAVIPAAPEEDDGEGTIDVEKPHDDNFLPLFNVDDVSEVYPVCNLGWPTPKALLGDLDGDGDDEYILANEKGGGERKGNAGFALEANPNFDFSIFERVEAITLDLLFLQDGFEMGTDEVTLRFLAGGTYNSYDANNAILSATFMAFRGEALGNGWYRVTIPAEEFNYTSADNTGNPFTWEGVYNMHIIFANRAFGDTMQVAIDNIGVVLGEEKEQAPVNVYASLDSAKLVLTEDFGLRFNATIQNATGAYIEYTYNGQTFTADPTEVNGQSYAFDFDGILAHQLGDKVSATIWAIGADGKLVSDSITDYSVAQYCTNMLAKYGDNEGLKRLLASVLVYGSYAQIYADYNADKLVIGDNWAAYEIIGTRLVADYADKLLIKNVLVGEATDDKVWTGATLVLGSSMKIRYYFEAESVEGLVVNVSKSGMPVGTVTEFVEEDGQYYFEVPVFANEYASIVSVDFGTGYSVNYSVNHYLAKNCDNVDLAEMLDAIFCYGWQARVYSGMSAY